jgi:hypothetical protein
MPCDGSTPEGTKFNNESDAEMPGLKPTYGLLRQARDDFQVGGYMLKLKLKLKLMLMLMLGE